MLRSSHFCSFSQILDVVRQDSAVKIHADYTYLKERFIGYNILFIKHKKVFLFLEIDLLAIS